MYLSKWQLFITPDLLNPYELHRLLWQAFPGQPESERPFLFRIEGRPNSCFRTVLMQSSLKPQAVAADNLELLGCKAMPVNFHKTQKLRFLSCVNPVKRLAQSRKRVPLIQEEQQIQWLQNQLSAAAHIQPENVQMLQRENLFFRKHDKHLDKKRPGKIATVTFSGLLEVHDADALQQLLAQGIGPAKCFGCGLLSLAAV